MGPTRHARFNYPAHPARPACSMFKSSFKTCFIVLKRPNLKTAT